MADHDAVAGCRPEPRDLTVELVAHRPSPTLLDHVSRTARVQPHPFAPRSFGTAVPAAGGRRVAQEPHAQAADPRCRWVVSERTNASEPSMSVTREPLLSLAVELLARADLAQV